MRVRADGNDFSAQITISGQNLPAGIGLRKAVGQAAREAEAEMDAESATADESADGASEPPVSSEADPVEPQDEAPADSDNPDAKP